MDKVRSDVNIKQGNNILIKEEYGHNFIRSDIYEDNQSDIKSETEGKEEVYGIYTEPIINISCNNKSLLPIINSETNSANIVLKEEYGHNFIRSDIDEEYNKSNIKSKTEGDDEEYGNYTEPIINISCDNESLLPINFETNIENGAPSEVPIKIKEEKLSCEGEERWVMDGIVSDSCYDAHLSSNFNDREMFMPSTSSNDTLPYSMNAPSKAQNNKELLPCKDCFKMFTRKNLNKHKLVHGAYRYPCTVCEKRFKRSDNLRNHMRLHTGERPFSCNLCDESYATSSGLRKHSLVHLGAKRFNCDLCDKGFNFKNDILKHIAHSHNGEERKRKYTCTMCPKSFYSTTHFQSHLKMHLEGKPHSCEICHSTFGCKAALTKHMKIHDATTN